MSWKSFVLIFLLVIVVVALLASRYFQRDTISVVYRTKKADRGNILSYVSATGTINPVTVAEVGSQIAGVIKTIYADFNSEVKQGDALAEIDPTPFSIQIKQAEINIKKAQTDVRIVEKTMRENEELYRKRLISKEELDISKNKYADAIAALDQAKIALEIARTNLDSTTIRAPIHGTIISRNVNIGQTVAPNFQAPPLFLIAADLTNMKLDASVNEADIGKVQEGQKASFSVDAYPDQTFSGQVWQIRNAPIVTQNVVTYSVLLRVENQALQLKPGMTAEVKILVASRQHVLRVPRDALRFIPPPAARIETRELDATAVVWTLLPGDHLHAVPIKPGISDDNFTEVLDGQLTEGDAVVVEAIEKGTTGSQPLGPGVLPQPKRF
jgi:HlyD family secretion protein